LQIRAAAMKRCQRFTASNGSWRTEGLLFRTEEVRPLEVDRALKRAGPRIAGRLALLLESRKDNARSAAPSSS